MLSKANFELGGGFTKAVCCAWRVAEVQSLLGASWGCHEAGGLPLQHGSAQLQCASGAPNAAPRCGPPPEVAIVSLWLGTCCCSFPHIVRAAAAEIDQLHAELVIKKLEEARLPCTYNRSKGYPTLDELLSVGIQRLQDNKTWKLWKWPPAAKEFLSAMEFRCGQQVCTLVEAMQRDLLGLCVTLVAKGAVGGLLLIGLYLPSFCRHRTPHRCAPAALSITAHSFEMGLIQSFILAALQAVHQGELH